MAGQAIGICIWLYRIGPYMFAHQAQWDILTKSSPSSTDTSRLPILADWQYYKWWKVHYGLCIMYTQHYLIFTQQELSSSWDGRRWPQQTWV